MPAARHARVAHVMLHREGMSGIRRFIIVRCGDSELFESLCRRFIDDPRIVISYDRRTTTRRTSPRPIDVERRNRDRRVADDAAILASRGYFATRASRPPTTRS